MFIKKTFCRQISRGFSLVELLLVLSLAPIVFFAVYSNFAAGVQLWQRLQVATPEEDQAIFRIKAQRDFQNVMRYRSLPFQGDKESVSFMAGIQADRELGGSHAIGRVRYFYDPSAHAITREVKDFSQIYKEAAGQVTILATGIRSLELSYLVKDEFGKEYIWQDEYEPSKPDNLPLAVRLTYTTLNSSENAEQTFFIPAGGEL